MSGRDRTGLRWIALAVITLVGCQTTVTTNDGRPPPAKPREVPPPPSAARVNSMAMQVAVKGVDTNGNGYPDTIPVEVYLFAQPHPMPVREVGAFSFRLIQVGAEEPLVTWHFDAEEVAQSWLRSPLFGEGYGFGLNLLEGGSDVIPLTAVNLYCRFEPSTGDRMVRSDGIHSVQIGKR